MKPNDYAWLYVNDGKWEVHFNTQGFPSAYSEQVVLIGGPKNQDLTDQIVYIKPGLTYLNFPTGEWDEEHLEGSFFSSYSKQKYGAFKGLYFNPSPFGLSMHNLPNAGAASKPAYEKGRRVMFWESMSTTEAYWEWEKRGNNLANNNVWTPGKDCVF